MAYDGKILRRATARYDEDKQRRAEQFRARRRICCDREPRLGEIDRELRLTVAKIVQSSLRRGADPRSAIAALRQENLALQRERGELLAGLGYPVDYLTEQPACKLCNDTGWVDGGMCRCLKEYYAREQNAELSQMLDLGHQSFESFRFDVYSHQPFPGKNASPYQRMEKNFDACRDYAYEFSPKSGNLLLSGAPGLGKTFLSASIARVVSDHGHSVVYDTAAHVFERMETQKFARDDDEAEDDVTRYLKCDLLILDDLGTEMNTAFVQSALYRIINTRLMENRKTIISSNLNPVELGQRYGAAVQSRLEGEYRILPFFGDDVRKLKNR